MGKMGKISNIYAVVGGSTNKDINITDVNGLLQVLDAKVDEVVGKQLTSADYTIEEKNKLAQHTAPFTIEEKNKLALNTAPFTTDDKSMLDMWQQEMEFPNNTIRDGANNLYFQTIEQKNNNDAHSPIQAQLDSKASSFIADKNMIELQQAINTKLPLSSFTVPIVQSMAFKPLTDGNYWCRNMFTGSATLGLPFVSGMALFTGTISTPNEARVIFPYNVSLNSSATLNSGYRYAAFQPISGPNSFQNKRTQLFFMLPSVDAPNRLVRFGFKVGSYFPTAVTDGFYIEINNLTLSLKSTLNSLTTININTFTLSKMVMYKAQFTVNSTRTLITFDLFLFGGAAPIYTATISSNITFGGSHYDVIEAQNLGTAATSLIYLYEFNHGTVEGQNKLG